MLVSKGRYDSLATETNGERVAVPLVQSSKFLTQVLFRVGQGTTTLLEELQNRLLNTNPFSR